MGGIGDDKRVVASASVVGRGPISSTVLTAILWCMAALFGLNTVGNARGLHPRAVGGGTVTAVLAILCALIAAD